MKWRIFSSGIILVCGLFFSIGSSILLQEEELKEARVNFDRIALKVFSDFNQSLKQDQAVIQALQAAYLHLPQKDHPESLSALAETLSKTRGNTTALGIALPLTGREAMSSVKKNRKKNRPPLKLSDFNRHELSVDDPTADLMPVVFSYHSEDWVVSNGTDLFSDKALRETILNAIDNNSQKIIRTHLPLDASAGNANLWFLSPFSLAEPSDVAAGPPGDKATGLVFLALPIKDIFAPIIQNPEVENMTAVILRESGLPGVEPVYFYGTNQILDETFFTQHDLEIAGEKMELLVFASPNYMALQKSSLSLTFLMIGLCLTLILSVLAWFAGKQVSFFQGKVIEQTRLAETYQKMILDIAKSKDVKEAMQTGLIHVCSYSGWPVGHVYVPDDKGVEAIANLWQIENLNRFNNFKVNYESRSFISGKGLTDRVLENERYIAITDITLDPSFSKSKITMNLGIRGAYGFPVWVYGEIYAVLEFFSEKPFDDSEAIPKVVNSLVAQIGEAIERIHAMNTFQEHEGIIREYSRQIAKGILIFDEKGKIHSLSALGEKTLGYHQREMVHRYISEFITDQPQEPAPLETTLNFEQIIRRKGTPLPLFAVRKTRFLKPILMTISEIKLADHRLFFAIIEEALEG